MWFLGRLWHKISNDASTNFLAITRELITHVNNNLQEKNYLPIFNYKSKIIWLSFLNKKTEYILTLYLKEWSGKFNEFCQIYFHLCTEKNSWIIMKINIGLI